MTDDCVGPLVSVVIPVYNNESYIRTCICSVTAQTYRNLEIIVVNDGSQDDSRAIIEQCALADARIRCVDQSNQGANLARKAGLDMATGKYIQYLDGDDTLYPDAIERLVEKAEATLADIVSAPFVFCNEDGVRLNSPVLREDQLNGIDYFKKIFEWEGATWNMWGNFQKRSLVYDYDIEILSDMPYGQDATWMIQIFLRNPKIATLKEPILNYNQNLQSVSLSKSGAAKRYKGMRALYYWFETLIKNREQEHEFGKELAVMQSDMTFGCIRALRFENAREDMKTYLENLISYPALIARLPRHEQLLVKAFRTSPAFGYIFLWCYRIKVAITKFNKRK